MGNTLNKIKHGLHLDGDKVNMNILEMGFYGIMPMGQLLMRVIKFNGSLDKWYLLFPLLLIPPFSFIPVIFAKMGFIKKSKDDAPPLDLYVLIPIIFRFILILFIKQVADMKTFMIQVGLVFGALIVTNILRHYHARKCSNMSFFGSITKGSFDSMLEYSFGVMTTFLVMFIPFIGQILEFILTIPIPYISQIVESIIWGFGLAGGYLMVNMFDANFDKTSDYCAGKVSTTRMIVSSIAFAIALFYQFKNLII
jgi:hypothetical protein